MAALRLAGASRAQSPAAFEQWLWLLGSCAARPGDAEFAHSVTQRCRLHAEPPRRAALAFDDPVRFLQRAENVISLDAVEITFGLGIAAVRVLVATVRSRRPGRR